MAQWYVSALASGGGDGSSGDPFTPAEANANVSTGDKVWVKADGTYSTADGTSVFLNVLNGTSTLIITWEGYTTTPGDGGQVLVDGGGTITYGINSANYNNWKNFKVTDCTYGFYSNDTGPKFENCHAYDCATNGFNTQAATRCHFHECTADNCGTHGFNVDATDACTYCISANNSQVGFDFNGVDNSVAFNCIAYGNGDRQFQGQIGYFINCVADGDGVADGYQITSLTNNRIIINCIAYDCVNGIDYSNASGVGIDAEGLGFIRGVVFYNCTNNYETASVDDDLIVDCTTASADPFTDAANRDYTLTSSSEAINAGIDITSVLALKP
jgi:hypothetical protein